MEQLTIQVIRLLAVIENPREPCNMLIMELADRGTLADVLNLARENKARKGLDVDILQTRHRIQMASDIAAGMTYLAALGYVHRCLTSRYGRVSTPIVIEVQVWDITLLHRSHNLGHASSTSVSESKSGILGNIATFEGLLQVRMNR
jgi:hypothetical protein